MKNYSAIFLSLFAASILASCGDSTATDATDSVERADSVRALLIQDSLKRDSVRMDSIARADVAPTQSSNPEQLEKDIRAEKVKVLFEGFGTEPFWTIYITKYELLLVNDGMDTKASYLLVNRFDSKLEKQTITYKSDDGKTESVVIAREEASPGMGPGIYPYSIRRSPILEGAGDTLYIKDQSKYEREVN